VTGASAKLVIASRPAGIEPCCEVERSVLGRHHGSDRRERLAAGEFRSTPARRTPGAASSPRRPGADLEAHCAGSKVHRGSADAGLVVRQIASTARGGQPTPRVHPEDEAAHLVGGTAASAAGEIGAASA
jgi:hypothetical protein